MLGPLKLPKTSKSRHPLGSNTELDYLAAGASCIPELGGQCDLTAHDEWMEHGQRMSAARRDWASGLEEEARKVLEME